MIKKFWDRWTKPKPLKEEKMNEYTYKYAGSVTYQKCSHSGNFSLYKPEEVPAALYLAGWTRGASLHGISAVIDLTGTQPVHFPSLVMGVGFTKFLEKQPVWMAFPIKDFGIPNQRKEDWMNLALDILDLLKDEKSVLIACAGGHGRTGLVGSILGNLLKVPGYDTDPIGTLRASYCKEAIETREQENYVLRMCGLPEKAAPPSSYTSVPVTTTTTPAAKQKLHEHRCDRCGRLTPRSTGVCESCQAKLQKLCTVNNRILIHRKRPDVCAVCNKKGCHGIVAKCGHIVHSIRDVDVTHTSGGIICYDCFTKNHEAHKAEDEEKADSESKSPTVKVEHTKREENTEEQRFFCPVCANPCRENAICHACEAELIDAGAFSTGIKVHGDDLTFMHTCGHLSYGDKLARETYGSCKCPECRAGRERSK